MKAYSFSPFTVRSFSVWALITSVLIFFFMNVLPVFSATTPKLNNADSTVIEYLKLTVPKNEKDAWLAAEKGSWEPWLKKQKGFVKRELFWDPNNEEALLLIIWATRSDWKNIPQSEIDKVQLAFKELAMELTQEKLVNPFPIKSQGEFLPQ